MKTLSETHPANIFHYCPKCGSNNFIFNGVKVFKCSNCGLNYFINPAPAVAVILEYPDGSIVLTRRKFDPRKDTFDLPGGFVDMNESIEDAVKREIFEELHISITEMKYIGSFPNEYVFKGVSYFTCDMAFVCKLNNNTILKPADDVSEAILIKTKDIDYQQISFPSITNILKRYINLKSDEI